MEWLWNLKEAYGLKNVSDGLGNVLDEVEDVLSGVGDGADDPLGQVGSNIAKGGGACKEQRLEINRNPIQYFSRMLSKDLRLTKYIKRN